jgi:short-subunit dehydrogenase
VARLDLRGKRALITGASSGIGAEVARVLAAEGAHLGLLARRSERLESLAQELRRAHAIEAVPITADLSDPARVPQIARDAAERLGQVDVLVNNAGLGQYGQFIGDDPQRMMTIVMVNVAALTSFTRELIGPMVARRFGLVINIASMAGMQPTPNMVVYGASKAYVVSFSQALWRELKGTGVHVSCVCPGYTATEFFSHGGYDRQASRPAERAMAADRVARVAVEGALRGRIVVIPGLKNRILSLAPRFTTRRGVLYVADKVLAEHKRNER